MRGGLRGRSATSAHLPKTSPGQGISSSSIGAEDHVTILSTSRRTNFLAGTASLVEPDPNQCSLREDDYSARHKTGTDSMI